MKKTTTSNPLKFFNDNKAMAYKKASGTMATYKKSLKKAQEGMSFKNTYAGPITESDSKRLDQQFPSTVNAPIPFAANKPNTTYGDNAVANEKNDRAGFENYLRSPAVGVNNKTYGTGFNKETLNNQLYNRDAQVKDMNTMNNIDWSSEDGKRKSFLLNRQVTEGYKKGGTHKMPNGKVMLNSAMKKKTSKKK